MDEDMIQNFKDLREESQQKRASNRENSLTILQATGLPFESRNKGAHIIVMVGEFVDFWPGTGKWSVRGGIQGRGIFNLLKELGVPRPKVERNKLEGQG